MQLKTRFKQLRDAYVVHQARSAALPAFVPDRLCRYRIVFSGRVQKVGFRLEVSELASRLGLTGFCRNLDSGDVLAEVQGEDNKIQFLLTFMGSLKRIRIRNLTMDEMEVIPEETRFLQK